MTKQIRVAMGDNTAHGLRVSQYQTGADGEKRLVRVAIVTDPTAIAQLQIYGQADGDGAMFVTIDEAPAGAEETRANLHGIVTGDDNVIDSRLRIDQWGSIEHPNWPGVRLFAPLGYKYATTHQQRANIRGQTSTEPDGTEIASGLPPFGWAEVPSNLQGFQIPLQRDAGDDGFGGKRWEPADGFTDDKGKASYAFVRYRLRRCNTLNEIAAELRAAEARGTVFKRGDAKD